MIKLAVFDLDNTLLKSDKTLDNKTIDALKTLDQMNIKTVLATGRIYQMAKPFAQVLKLNGPIVCNNGAQIVTLDDETPIHEHIVSKRAQSKAIDYAIENNYTHIVYTKEGIYTSSKNRLDVYNEWNHKYPISKISLTLSDDVKKLKSLDAFKVLIVIDEPSQFQVAKDYFKSFDYMNATQSSENFLDIIPKGINKGQALDVLMQHYKVHNDEVLVFGDSDNDAEMLKKAGLSFAMKNGTKKALASAKYQTDFTTNEGGVRKTINRLIADKILIKKSIRLFECLN